MSDDRGHVIVFVFGEAASEDHAGCAVGVCGDGFAEVAVLGVAGGVTGVGHGVKRLHAGTPLGGVFA